jgi:asparagine synthase (glutamine-hydrolysing)
MEKWVVRKAFEHVARKCCLETKEQFSDGVGYGWIDNLKEEW